MNRSHKKNIISSLENTGANIPAPFSISIPLKQSEKPSDFPKNFDKLVYEEYISRYLESMHVSPNKRNADLLKRHVPMDHCRMTAAWKSRGWNSDSINVAPINRMSKNKSVTVLPSDIVHSNLEFEKSAFSDSLDSIVNTMAPSLGKFVPPTSHFAPNLYDVPSTVSYVDGDLSLFSSSPKTNISDSLSFQHLFLKEFKFDVQPKIAIQEEHLSRSIILSSTMCIFIGFLLNLFLAYLICLTSHYVYWALFGSLCRSPLPPSVLQRVFLYMQSCFFSLNSSMKSSIKYSTFLLPLFMDTLCFCVSKQLTTQYPYFSDKTNSTNSILKVVEILYDPNAIISQTRETAKLSNLTQSRLLGPYSLRTTDTFRTTSPFIKTMFFKPASLRVRKMLTGKSEDSSKSNVNSQNSESKFGRLGLDDGPILLDDIIPKLGSHSRLTMYNMANVYLSKKINEVNQDEVETFIHTLNEI